MKDERNVRLLLAILVSFGVSVGLVQGRKLLFSSHAANAAAISQDDVHNLSVDQAYRYMQSILISRNIPLLVQIISRMGAKQAPEILQRMIQDEISPLNKEEKIEVLLGVAKRLQNRKVMYRIFDLLLSDEHVLRTPLLVVAARSEYHDVIPVILRWMQDRSGKRIVKGMIDSALSYAINDNDLPTLDVLFSKQLKINQKKASQLLWNVVVRKKDISFIPFLVHQARADINVSIDGKRTPLIIAVQQNRLPMVRVLLEEGAKPSKMVNIDVGTPLQIAIEKEFTAIETLLREYEAKS